MGRDVVVIGGGAAGMTAAIMAARQGAKVTLLEASPKLGRKLAVTGNGRCNLTNTRWPGDALRGGEPLFSQLVLSAFPVVEAVSFFLSLGIFTENVEGGLYPRSFQAQSVVDAFAQEVGHLKIRQKYNERAVSIVPGEEKPWLVKSPTWQYPADAVIVCCGSPAHPETGASGDGYELARGLGHHVVKPLPALAPLVCEGASSLSWAGVRARGRVSIEAEGELLSADEGELQLTEYGISGIPVFNVSRYAIRALDEGKRVRAHLDFLPEFDEAGARGLLARLRDSCPYKDERHLLMGIFPDKLCTALLKRGGDPVGAIKDLSLKVTGALEERAQVMSGGVSLSEVDPGTLQSRLAPGVYFAGEVLDVEGRCGGYNLQWAFSTGALAGRAAAEAGGEG